MRGISCTNVPTITLSSSIHWYRKSCCVNGATGLPNDTIWAETTMKCAKILNPSRIGCRINKDRARVSGREARSKKFEIVSLIVYPQLEAPSWPRCPSGERMGSAQGSSTPGDLKATRKRWSWSRETKFCTEQMFVLVSMQLRNHEETQPAKRYKR